jgi:hypothetical protein
VLAVLLATRRDFPSISKSSERPVLEEYLKRALVRFRLDEAVAIARSEWASAHKIVVKQELAEDGDPDLGETLLAEESIAIAREMMERSLVGKPMAHRRPGGGHLADTITEETSTSSLSASKREAHMARRNEARAKWKSGRNDGQQWTSQASSQQANLADSLRQAEQSLMKLDFTSGRFRLPSYVSQSSRPR